jgi:CPA2 family monovalent cation:H+ antiporter-2
VRPPSGGGARPAPRGGQLPSLRFTNSTDAVVAVRVAARAAQAEEVMDGHTFLKALAIVLCVAAATTVLFSRLRLPVVLGYVLAGMLVGPYIPVPLVADRAVVQTLSELGVTLLMFSLGLEFSLRKLVRIGMAAGIIVIIEVGTMLSLGYFVARLLGFRPIEAVFTGAIVSISSTMIIAKTFAERRPDRSHAELVFGILVFEDLMAILLLAALTALSAGGLSAGTLLSTAGRLVLFLLVLLVLGLLLIPRIVRAVVRRGSNETLLILCVGLCFAVALLAQAFGYSVALGAFVCGSLVAESGEGKRIEPLLHPLRDLFGAIFFVSVGMSIDPVILARHYKEGLLLIGLVVFGKIVGVTLGAFFTGNSLRLSLQTAMTLAQIGEFSFIIAGLGVSQGAVREFIYPLAVGVSTITALGTPALIRASLPVAAFIDRRLPRPMQNFLTLYASWVEKLRSGERPASRVRARRLFFRIAIDDVCIAGLYIGAALSFGRLHKLIAQRFGEVSPFLAGVAVAAVALLLSVPFWVGLVRTARRLAQVLAARAIAPARLGEADLGSAPRRVLALTMHILVLLAAGAPLVLSTEAFLPALLWFVGVLVWLVLIGVFAVAFWRSATNLLGHVRAGAEAIVEFLAAQAHSQDSEHELEAARSDHSRPALPPSLLSGMGTLDTCHVAPGDPCIGKSLAELNLRGLTGATVLAIVRDSGNIPSPGAREILREGDVLGLLGDAESVKSARRLLHGEGLPSDESYAFFAMSASE